MPAAAKYEIRSLTPVGRYALGVKWGDDHDSIFPHESLRRLCPCTGCGAAQAVRRQPGDEERRLDGVEQIADRSVMLYWGDGHESLFLVEELREVCGCAACKGEPDYPITGR